MPGCGIKTRIYECLKKSPLPSAAGEFKKCYAITVVSMFSQRDCSKENTKWENRKRLIGWSNVKWQVASAGTHCAQWANNPNKGAMFPGTRGTATVAKPTEIAKRLSSTKMPLVSDLGTCLPGIRVASWVGVARRKNASRQLGAATLGYFCWPTKSSTSTLSPTMLTFGLAPPPPCTG